MTRLTPALPLALLVAALGLALALALELALVSAPAHAWESYRRMIPNGDNVRTDDGEIWAGVGHTSFFGGGPTNAFGRDFGRAGYKWTKELCEKDSDKDGKTNGQELGDPECTWKQGEKPKFSCATNPGIKNDEDEFCEGNVRPGDVAQAPKVTGERDL